MTVANLPIALFDPRGRCNRKGLLVVALGMLVAEIIVGVVVLCGAVGLDHPAMVASKAVLMLAAVSAAAQRLHDTGRTAWWIAGALIGLFAGGLALSFGLLQFMSLESLQPGGSAFLIVTTAITLPMLAMMLWLHFAPGEARANRFGPVPEGLGFARCIRSGEPAHGTSSAVPA